MVARGGACYKLNMTAETKRLLLPKTMASPGWDFVKTAYVFNEGSDAALGLPYRWIIKGIMYAGLWLLLLGIVSVLLRLIAFLFGKRPAEEVELRIGQSVSQV